MRIKVKRSNFITRLGAFTFYNKITKETKRQVCSFGALTGYIKSYARHPNVTILEVEVPHGWVQKTREWVKKEFETK